MRIRTSDNKEQQIEELTYGKEYKENNAKRISRHNIERVNYQVGKPFLWKYRCVASKNFVSMMARLLASTQMTKGISQVQAYTMTNFLIKTSSV